MGFAFSKELQANASQFTIRVQGLPESLFIVNDFNSENDALAEDFQFNVRVVAKQVLNCQSILGKDVTLSVLWNNTEKTVTGIVSEVIGHGQNQQGFHYTITISSLLTLLKHSRSNRIFTDMSVDEIVRSVLQKAGFPMDKLQLNTQGPTLAMTVQYDESDYAFVTRLMRQYGLIYSVVEVSAGLSNLLVVANTNALSQYCDAITLSYIPPSGQVRNSESVFAVSEITQLRNHSVRFDDYDYQTASSFSNRQQNATQSPGFGEQCSYGANIADQAQATLLAETAMQAIDCARRTLLFDTDCRALRPGSVINLVDHDQFSGNYLVVRVEHQASQSHGLTYGDNVKGLNYKNQVHAIPTSIPFKAEPIAAKRVFATFSATIENEVDDNGEYRVNLPFNIDGEGQASKNTRLMTPYGGQGHGMHFPLTQGTEVLVCGENGDLDRPIILGALYSPSTPSPINSSNPTENKLVTRSGHSLLMDDAIGAEKIIMATNNSDNRLELNATNGAHFAELASKNGDVRVKAKEQVKIEAGGNITQSARQDITIRADQNIQMQSLEGDINVSAQQTLSQTATRDVSIIASDGDLSLSAQQALQLQSRDDISIYSSDGNLELQAQRGDLTLASGSNTTISCGQRGSIQLVQGRGSVEIDAAGNLSIDATTLTLSAQNIVIKGNAITNN